MVKIKICGLRRKEDIDYVNELKPDYAGFILTGGFRRSIDDDTARVLRARLCEEVSAVGVFVNDDIDRINRLATEGIIDIAQLHGNEPPEYCDKINAPVIKMLKPEEFTRIKEYEPYVDYFLFDSGTGTGRTFDWSKIVETAKPFFLAGGINKDNILKAVSDVKPYCIDLSSAVETDGIKDYNKIKQIMEILKNE